MAVDKSSVPSTWSSGEYLVLPGSRAQLRHSPAPYWAYAGAGDIVTVHQARHARSDVAIRMVFSL